MKIFTLAYLILAVFFTSCIQSPQKTEAQVTARDKSVTSAVSYSDLFIDSTSMEKFIKQQGLRDSLANKLRSFYNNRNYQCAWFFKEGIAEYATTFYEMCNDYIGYSGDSTLYNPLLQKLYDSVLSGNLKPDDSLAIKTELLFTSQFFR